ncbi:MAG TPA: hypothetical protein VMX15_06750 [Candidatus Heimdallarchaeota archaeon]|nr:hypothetical protein [Candidatus Heimdallarchaeota archaeon]
MKKDTATLIAHQRRPLAVRKSQRWNVHQAGGRLRCAQTFRAEFTEQQLRAMWCAQTYDGKEANCVK